MQSLIKMITSVHEGLTACPRDLPKFSLHPRVLEILGFGLRWLRRYEVVKKSILKKPSIWVWFFYPCTLFALVGNAVFKLLICLLWALRNRIFLPHLPNPWLRGAACWKWVSMAILCESPVMLCKRPAGSSAPLMMCSTPHRAEPQATRSFGGVRRQPEEHGAVPEVSGHYCRQDYFDNTTTSSGISLGKGMSCQR